MIGIAAGLTIGKIPFTGTSANFQQEGYMTKFVNQ
jgi:transketolase C-terminal domain/subunit